MNAQEIFDTVATHLLTQKRRAVSTAGTCKYRAGELRCAVGCLITDDEYKPEMEGNGVEGLGDKGLLPLRLVPHDDLLGALQACHDDNVPSEWPDILARIASDFGLNPAKVAS